MYTPVALCVPYPVPLRWHVLHRVFFFLSHPNAPQVHVVGYADTIGIEVKFVMPQNVMRKT